MPFTMYLDYLVQNKSIATLTQRYAHMLILCGFWKYSSGLFEHVYCWDKLLAENLINIWDYRGCASMPCILALLFHTQQSLGPFRWLEFMCRGELFGEPLLPCVSLTFNYYKHLMTSYTIGHEKIRLMSAKLQVISQHMPNLK